MNTINRFKTYEITASDNWNGIMGSMENPWGWNQEPMKFRYSVGDFDGQIEVLEGESKGKAVALQSWNYYEKKNGVYNSKIEEDKGKTFTIATYNYFFEIANRLNDYPIIRYAGEGKFNGKKMHKIYASWGTIKSSDYDQYLLWIGEESGLIEATTFTTRDNPKPAPKFLFASVRFDDYRDVDGILIPFKQTAQLMNPKDDINDFIQQLTVCEFVWDKFDVSSIRPLKGVQTRGDKK